MKTAVANTGEGAPLDGQSTSPELKPFSHIQVGNNVDDSTLKLEGLEASCPAVQKFRAALRTDSPIHLIDGGSTGKTETACTALALENKTFVRFDLRAWSLSRLGDPEWLRNFREDKASGIRVGELSQALKAVEKRYHPDITPEQLESHYYDDPGYLLKRAENLLLRHYYLDISNELRGSGADVALLDEFDLSCGEHFETCEIDSIDRLTDIFSHGGTQVVLITHPHSEQNEGVRDLVSGRFPKAIRLSAEYVPSQIAYKALELGGITGPDADRYVERCKGLPLAYVPLMSNRNNIRASGLTIDALEAMTEAQIAIVEKLILRGVGTKTAHQVYDFALGNAPKSLEPAEEQALLDTTFVYRNSRGDLAVAPIVAKVLSQIKRGIV